MAAYLNAAAANHLFLTHPMAAAAASSLVQASPRPLVAEETALDFSAKSETRADNEQLSDEDDEEGEEATNENEESETAADLSAPLDLSCSSRKRQSVEEERETPTPNSPNRKMPRSHEYKTPLNAAWTNPPINPYLAAVAAAGLSPKMASAFAADWNPSVKQKIAPNEATKALERMTEMTRLGAEKNEVASRASNVSGNAITPSNSNGRHSAWQSHWLNKGAHSVKEVFKCVWCKQSFPTLASLTTHMKETKHCGVSVPPHNNVSTPLATTSSPTTTSTATITSPTNSQHHNSNSNNMAGKKSDLNLLIKETMPLPRKLVRGQDVWLGKGAEQTRQILKCMWCGQSFRSLAEMTSHMQETQHYTNIISQEQIISWKSTDEKGAAASPPATPSATTVAQQSATATTGSNSNTVSAVLTCKVCDQAFPSLKELSNHMVKNAHYKEPALRPNNESPALGMPGRRGRQLREKRKKSLPVRKLLELERAQQDYGQKSHNSLDPALKPLRDFAASTKITCEKCGDKIETAHFVDHIRQCLGGALLATPRSAQQKSASYSPLMPEVGGSQSSGRKTSEDMSPLSSSDGDKANSLPSVLNAIEQLIEKSFDIRPPRQGHAHAGTPLGSSILKRLGIDDSVDYTKPLMEAQTLRYRTNSNFSARDRSASESSSVSERCSSLLEAATPERPAEQSRQATPRLLTPDKHCTTKETKKETGEQQEMPVEVKTEPVAETKEEPVVCAQKITVKKEFNMAETELDNTRKSSPALSPSASERSSTPLSTHSAEKKLTAAGSSLNALSSMFDSLSHMSASTLSFSGETNNNNNNNNNNNKGHGSKGGKKSSANPLAALQKLCETTDPPATNSRSNNAVATPVNGGIMSYNWAVGNEAELKCAFCDSTFYAKGAYRQHLSKVHFVKEESPVAVRQSPKSVTASPRSASKSPATQRHDLSPSIATPTINPYEESPQSKFRKYTELAKQLSSKNA